MQKLIILNNNLEFTKNLCNTIINEVPDIQLSGFATSMEEFDNLFSKVNPHIIMMNNTDYTNSKYRKKSEFKGLKIIFCDSSQSSRNTTKQLFISKNTKPIEILKSITKFVHDENLRLLRKKISKKLESFHIDFKLIGTKYIVESILYCYENRADYVSDNLERKVYPEVAKIFKVTTCNVKWGISRSTDIMNSCFSPSIRKQLSETFNLDIFEKITPKQLITTLVTKLC